MNIEVKPLQPGQEGIVCGIHNEAFRHWIDEFGVLYGYHGVSTADVERWAGRGEHVWLARVDGEPVGYTCCQVETGDDGVAQLLFVETREGLGQSKIAVLPGYQRRGVASAIVKHAMAFHARDGAKRALAIAYNDNHGATGLAGSLGFRKDAFFPFASLGFDKEAFYAVLWELDLRRPIRSVPVVPGLVVRALEEKDLDAIVSITLESRPDLRAVMTAGDIKAFYMRPEPWAEVSLVAEYQGKVVGLMDFTREGLVGIAGVLPRFRKCGIGSALFHQLLVTMQASGKEKALGDSGSIYMDAIRMYERFGFDTSRKLWIWTKPI
ncbi:MAG: GNAT family N-acetyltransferase [Candidatus Lokiarchaeota archaeon]|nr:GNAT family N-acetyltransferase [Candidatus Lokiarchaeota archaeon]